MSTESSPTSPSSTPSDAASAAEVNTLSYEQARDQLVRIVSQLESGQAPLEETMSLWERGQALAARCRGVLDAAERRVADAQTPAPTPFDPEDPTDDAQ